MNKKKLFVIGNEFSCSKFMEYTSLKSNVLNAKILSDLVDTGILKYKFNTVCPLCNNVIHEDIDIAEEENRIDCPYCKTKVDINTNDISVNYVVQKNPFAENKNKRWFIKPIILRDKQAIFVEKHSDDYIYKEIIPQPDIFHQYIQGVITSSTSNDDIGKVMFGTAETGGHCQLYRPPYEIGDYLYVKETWEEVETCHRVPFYTYKARDGYLYCDGNHDFHYWHSPVSMPVDAARTILKVTDIYAKQGPDSVWYWKINYSKVSDEENL